MGTRVPFFRFIQTSTSANTSANLIGVYSAAASTSATLVFTRASASEELEVDSMIWTIADTTGPITAYGDIESATELRVPYNIQHLDVSATFLENIFAPDIGSNSDLLVMSDEFTRLNDISTQMVWHFTVRFAEPLKILPQQYLACNFITDLSGLVVHNIAIKGNRRYKGKRSTLKWGGTIDES